MGWFSVLLSITAAYLLFVTGHIVLMVVAIVVAVGCLWSWGIMHNYATEMAKRRANYTGGFYDFTNQEVDVVPEWITTVNLVFTIMGIVLLIAGIVFKC